MLGENSFEGLMFSLAEIADPEILASYDWNSDFGVFQDSAPKFFFAQVRTIFFDTLNLDLSLFSPCLSTWTTAAGLEFFGDTLDAEDLMAYLHLLGDSKFGVVLDKISPKMFKYLVWHISNHKVGNSMSADLFNSAPNITVYR